VLYALSLNPIVGPNRGEYISDAAWGLPRIMSSESANSYAKSVKSVISETGTLMTYPVHFRFGIVELILDSEGIKTRQAFPFVRSKILFLRENLHFLHVGSQPLRPLLPICSRRSLICFGILEGIDKDLDSVCEMTRVSLNASHGIAEFVPFAISVGAVRGYPDTLFIVE
jgi:hypothetical protein